MGNRATWVQSNFNAGEWSPLTYGRYELDKYRNALALCQNYVPTVQGGLARRPGTRYVAQVKDSANPVRLVRFEFSTAQAYVLEFGNGYIRFYTQDGQLQLLSSPVEVATPYTGSDVNGLSFAQSADTLYICHPNYAPRKLQRSDAYSWNLNTVTAVDGPYLTTNTTITTLSPSGTSGTVTVSASSPVGINGGAGFLAADVGRLLRIKCGGAWLYGYISAYIDITHVSWTITDYLNRWVPLTARIKANVSGGSVFNCTVEDGGNGYGSAPPAISFPGGSTTAIGYTTVSKGVVSGVTMSVTGAGYSGSFYATVGAPVSPSANATTFWRLGAWGGTNGYPRCCVFHQDRLLFAGSVGQPNTIWGSNTSDYENFAPTDVDGSTGDSYAYTFTLNSNTVNAINWIVSDEFGLLAGTSGGEWVLVPSSTSAALTSSNVSARLSLQYGSAAVPPIRLDKSTLYVQRTGRKIREMLYQFVNNTFTAGDITQTGEHLTESGIKQMAAQLAPQQLLWIVRNDGTLVSMTYDKQQEVCGFSRHILGGYSDVAQTLPPVVESVATIPAPSITRDEVWVVAQRYINGAAVKYVEVLTKLWEDGDSPSSAVFMDSSAEYNGTATTIITGLTWLKGQTVSILADGAPRPQAVVSASGSITLDSAASVVQVGLGYASAGQTMRIEAGGGDGPAQGKLKRIHRIFMRFFQTVGISLRANFNGAVLTPMPFREPADPMDGPIGLFTGDKIWSWEGTYEREGQLYWEQSDPLPGNILMIAAQLETQDR